MLNSSMIQMGNQMANANSSQHPFAKFRKPAVPTFWRGDCSLFACRSMPQLPSVMMDVDMTTMGAKDVEGGAYHFRLPAGKDCIQAKSGLGLSICK